MVGGDRYRCPTLRRIWLLLLDFPGSRKTGRPRRTQTGKLSTVQGNYYSHSTAEVHMAG